MADGERPEYRRVVGPAQCDVVAAQVGAQAGHVGAQGFGFGEAGADGEGGGGGPMDSPYKRVRVVTTINFYLR